MDEKWVFYVIEHKISGKLEPKIMKRKRNEWNFDDLITGFFTLIWINELFMIFGLKFNERIMLKIENRKCFADDLQIANKTSPKKIAKKKLLKMKQSKNWDEIEMELNGTFRKIKRRKMKKILLFRRRTLCPIEWFIIWKLNFSTKCWGGMSQFCLRHLPFDIFISTYKKTQRISGVEWLTRLK